METIFTTMLAAMISLSNATSFSVNTPGEYYELSQTAYDPKVNTTYAIFSRYVVESKYSVHPMHFQLKHFTGHLTTKQILDDARFDNYINIVSAVK